MMVFMSLVLVLIGQFCRDVVGHQSVKIVVIAQLLLLAVIFNPSIVCWFRLRSTTQVVETSVTNNSLSKDYLHPDDCAKQITGFNIALFIFS